MIELSLEQEVKSFLLNKNVSYQDKSTSFKHLDFTIMYKGVPFFHLEVKEKRQKYNLNNWPEHIDEVNLFIVDDLTVRKCLAYSPISGILVRDNLRDLYFFLSVVDLALMPKKRVNRPIKRKISTIKGKWLINLNNGMSAETIETSFSYIRQYVNSIDEICYKQIECYGCYDGEKIGSGGIIRKPFHWETDVNLTR